MSGGMNVQGKNTVQPLGKFTFNVSTVLIKITKQLIDSLQDLKMVVELSFHHEATEKNDQFWVKLQSIRSINQDTTVTEKLFEQADNLFSDFNDPNSVLRAKKLVDSLSGLNGLEKMLLKQIFAQRNSSWIEYLKEELTPFITDGSMNLIKPQ